MSTDELAKYRANIDALDAEILALLNKRAEQARAIGALKKGAVTYRPEREAQILERIKSLNHGPLSNETAMYLFREIMSAGLAIQKPLTVAFLGPQGTFSETAAAKHFGHAAQLMPNNSIAEVFRSVEAGNTDYAVVPVENSTEGAVGITLDLLLQTPLCINSEIKLRIHQNLLRKTSSLDGIKKIYSHAQSLAQCQYWLQKNLPQVETVPVASNARAAQLAAEDVNSAAIAGEAAAKHYDLQIVQPNIEDNPNNTTRFLVLSPHAAAPSGKDKTSIAVGTENHPGSICDLLTPLAKQQINITRFDSRPSHAGVLEYIFFIDLEGHQHDPAIANMLTELKTKAAFIKFLGSYPVAVL